MSTQPTPSLVSRQLYEGPATVEYCQVLGFPDYWVGSDGTLWHLYRRKPYRMRDGRLRVQLSAGKRGCFVNRFVHHLALESFVGLRPDGMVACHQNDVPGDNQLENLRWDTPLANAADALRNGRIAKGSEASGAKLSDEDVVAIRALRRRGKSQEEVGALFGVHRSTISLIGLGKTWRDLLA
jgi:hypothetical protein